ncbi:hypothetical protein D3C79_608120 [compost metagenome]
MFEHAATGFLIGLGDGVRNLNLSDSQAGHAQRIEHYLVLLDHPAYRRHFGNVRKSFQLEAQEPVLKAAQLCQVMGTTAVHQRILVDPAYTSGIGSEHWLSGRR